jgi:glycosyltransferase involved in cell wall biosynthesis
MAASPIVSVVLPVYNRAALLARAIDSVRAQTFGAWELVVVDDASEDDTAAVAGGVADPRVRGVRRERNGGVAAALNTGLDEVRGRFVAFLHSDDEYLPEKLERQVPLLEGAPPEVGAVESGHEVVRQDGAERRPPFLGGRTSWDLLSYRSGVLLPPVMVRREVALELRFDEALRGTEDRDFCIRLLDRTRVMVDHTAVVRMHRTGPRLSTTPRPEKLIHLLGKYRHRLARDPRVLAGWHLRIARTCMAAGRVEEARRWARGAVTADPWRLRRWPLGAAAVAGERPFEWAFRRYLAQAARRAGSDEALWP